MCRCGVPCRHSNRVPTAVPALVSLRNCRIYSWLDEQLQRGGTLGTLTFFGRVEGGGVGALRDGSSVLTQRSKALSKTGGFVQNQF